MTPEISTDIVAPDTDAITVPSVREAREVREVKETTEVVKESTATGETTMAAMSVPGAITVEPASPAPHAVVEKDTSGDFRSHIAVLASPSVSAADLEASVDALLTALSGGHDPEARMEMVVAPMSLNGGTWVSQVPLMTYWQRVWNGQPGSGLSGEGISPSSTT